LGNSEKLILLVDRIFLVASGNFLLLPCLIAVAQRRPMNLGLGSQAEFKTQRDTGIVSLPLCRSNGPQAYRSEQFCLSHRFDQQGSRFRRRDAPETGPIRKGAGISCPGPPPLWAGSNRHSPAHHRGPPPPPSPSPQGKKLKKGGHDHTGYGLPAQSTILLIAGPPSRKLGVTMTAAGHIFLPRITMTNWACAGRPFPRCLRRGRAKGRAVGQIQRWFSALIIRTPRVPSIRSVSTPIAASRCRLYPRREP